MQPKAQSQANDMAEAVTSTELLLSESALGSSLNRADARRVAALAVCSESAAGTVLFNEGNPADALWVVCSGSIGLEMHVPTRGTIRILTLGPGDVLGWSALVGDGSMSATAAVLENATLLRLPAEKLRQLCDADPVLGYALMRQIACALARRLRATRLQLLDLFLETEPGLVESDAGQPV